MSISYLELIRTRVRRELELFQRRTYLTNWELAKVLNTSSGVVSSRRDSPNISHRTIAGILNGKRSNFSTIKFIADFLVYKTGLPEFAFAVSDQSVRTAKEYIRFARLDAIRTLDRRKLSQYAGAYTIKAGLSPFSLGVLLDHETQQNILLARAILRHNVSEVEVSTTFLEGFAIPEQHQMVIVLRHPVYGSSYTIQIPDLDNELANRGEEKFQLRGGESVVEKWAEISFPRYVSRVEQVDIVQPTMRMRDSGDKFAYKITRWNCGNAELIDILRDSYDVILFGLRDVSDFVMHENTISFLSWNNNPLASNPAYKGLIKYRKNLTA